MKILHIVTHLGGGIGTVLLNWAKLDLENTHIFMCLGYNFDKVIEKCADAKIELHSNVSYDSICTKIKDADIVVLHYWNYPLLLDFMLKSNLPPCRLIVYSHISGRWMPYVIPSKLFAYADKVIHTSSASKNATTQNTIMSTGGVERYKNINHKEHNGVNILYVGTLDFAKLRDDFVNICYDISKEILDVHFIVCGVGSSKESIEKQAIALGIKDRFTFTGLVDDLSQYLEIADVFLYPLTHSHYGTGEQVLGEAMSCGVIPIVYNNPCEMEIVHHFKNGFVVQNSRECVLAIKTILNNKKTRATLSLNAKETSQEMYSIKKFIEKWRLLFSEVSSLGKKERTWPSSLPSSYDPGLKAFLESLGDDGEVFITYILSEARLKTTLKLSKQWESDSKGSIKQYLGCFPNDVYLNKFQKILEGTYDDRN